MNDLLFALTLALAWLAATNIVASVLAAVAAHALDWLRPQTRPETAARTFLSLRLLPGAVSLFFISALFLPAHWRLEPAETDESVGYSLILFAATGALILAVTAFRAVRGFRSTHSLVSHWAGHAGQPGLLHDGIPVYRVSIPTPVVALVGVLRPRLFVSDAVADALTAAELDAALAHEAAHRRSRDNFKRLLAACSPDALALTGLGHLLADRWRATMEFAADAKAVAGSDEKAVALASALVKVARLAPIAPPAAATLSGLHDEALLAARIARLLSPQVEAALAPAPRFPRLAAAGAVTMAIVVPIEQTWLAVHEITEGLIRLLP